MKKILLLFLTVFFALAVDAQITTTSITGTITDSQGGPLPGATVVATHTPSGTTYGAVTLADGRYRILGMRVGGPYSVKISFVGYKDQEFNEIYLSLNVAGDINAKLADESTQLDAVVISADKQGIFSSDRTGAAASFGNGMINSTPTIGRTITDILKYNAYSNGSSFAGQDSRFNNFTIDGSVFNNGFGLGTSAIAGGRTGTTPVSLDAFDEFQLNVAPFDVRQSGFAGANINAVTRSGTNKFSGSAYNINRGNKVLTGHYVNGTELSGLTVNEKTWGARLGGPIIKNKLFFFANAEQFKSSTPALSWNLDRGSAGGNISRVKESDLSTLSDFMKTNFNWDGGALDRFNINLTSKKFLVRLDYNINTNHKLALRYSQHDSQSDQIINNSNSSNTAGFGQRTNLATAISMQGTGYYILDNTKSIALELNSNLSSKLSNKAILTYNRQVEDRKYRQGVFPTIDILNGGSTYTSVGFDPFTPDNKLRYSTLNFTDNLTYFANKHTITAGISYEYFRSDNLFFASSNGVYVYNSLADFYTAANEYIANPSYTSTTVNVNKYNLRVSLLPNGAKPWQILKSSTYSFYVQDEFQLSEKLKITGGVRGDIFSYSNATTKDYNNSVVAGLTFHDEKDNPYNVTTGAFPKAKLLISPRIGVNYDLTGDKKTQLRGGTGIFVSRIPQVLVSNQLSNNGVNTALVTLTGNVPFRVNPADLPSGLINASAPTGYVVNASDGGLKYPMILKTNLAVDRKLPFGFIGTIEGIHNKTIKGLRYIDANLKPANENFTGSDGRDRFNYPGNYAGTTVSNRYVNSAVSNVFVLKNTNKGFSYTITGKLERPAVKGLGGMVAYTYGLARDLQSVASTVLANIPTVTGQNYLSTAYADNDLRHRIIGYVNYRKEIGDKQGSAITVTLGAQATSGYKVSYIYGNDMNGDGQTNDLIYVPNSASELNFATFTAGGKTFTQADQQAALDDYISKDKYLSSRKGKYAERNGQAAPWLTRFDFTIARDAFVKIAGNKHAIQIRLDILNAANLFKDKWGVSYSSTTTQPLTVTGVDINGLPTYRLATQTITKPDKTTEVILLRDRFVKSLTINNTWQAQLTLRYLFN